MRALRAKKLKTHKIVASQRKSLTRSSRARHGGPAGVAGHSNVEHSSHLDPTSTPGWHVKTRVCPPLVAPISPSPRSVPRSFSTETSLLVPSHDAPLMLGPWRVRHSSNHSPTRPHDPSAGHTGILPRDICRLFENAPVGRKQNTSRFGRFLNLRG